MTDGFVFDMAGRKNVKHFVVSKDPRRACLWGKKNKIPNKYFWWCADIESALLSQGLNIVYGIRCEIHEIDKEQK